VIDVPAHDSNSASDNAPTRLGAAEEGILMLLLLF
jgi:hypothetical protein